MLTRIWKKKNSANTVAGNRFKKTKSMFFGNFQKGLQEQK